jgi:hypothetical protein
MRISNVSPPSVKGVPDARGSGTQFSTPLSGQARSGLLLNPRGDSISAEYFERSPTAETTNSRTAVFSKKAAANRSGFRYTAHGEKATWTLIN